MLLLENKLLRKQLFKNKPPVEMKQLSAESGHSTEELQRVSIRSQVADTWSRQTADSLGSLHEENMLPAQHTY